MDANPQQSQQQHPQQQPQQPYPTSNAASMGSSSMVPQPSSLSSSSYLDQNGGDDSGSISGGGNGNSNSSGAMLDGNNYDCKICSVKCKGMSEYLKHLSKVHFKHKLLTMVPKSRPYKCPWNGCEVVKKDRYNISLHYGMTHKVALKLMQEMPEDALNEDVEAVCKLCQQSFTAHRYLYTHLADTHFQVYYLEIFIIIIP